tara:strand:- start:2552 stop:3166 length:615 start_codon:yes stop_codon:yes gene_type:complete
MNPPLNYFVEYWDCGVEERNLEVIDVINSNIESGFFNTVTVFSSRYESRIKCNTTPCDRITYQMVFDMQSSGVNILSNSDIKFDKTILKSRDITYREFWALTRYELDGSRHKHDDPYKGSDSQDVWIWKDQCRIRQANFTLGVAGCDNRVAAEAHIAGYDVLNPSESITTWHHHTSRARPGSSNFKATGVRIPQPYKLVEVGSL